MAPGKKCTINFDLLQGEQLFPNLCEYPPTHIYNKSLYNTYVYRMTYSTILGQIPIYCCSK